LTRGARIPAAKPALSLARTSGTKNPSFFECAEEFRGWLEANASTSAELLVGYWKVGSGRPSMTWSESVDEALCFGWIDGVRKRIDDYTYSIRFTPRKSSSIWSAVNVSKFTKLQEQGRMTPAGARAFASRTERRSAVYAYEQALTAELSRDECRQFRLNKAAWAFFAATPPGYKKVILHWITTARRPETRTSRFAKLVEACAAGERLR
jgi:uncharacterized protein YdeI (YjbR/CyaY-like superfamily)